MPEISERDTQSKVKHEILDEYLIKWGSIITKGLKAHYARNPHLRSQFKTRFVYIDYFAYSGVYSENKAVVYGSPILGIKRLDEIKKFFATQTNGLNPTISVILFEEDNTEYGKLISNLSSLKYADRVKQTDDFTSLEDGDIAVVRGNSSDYTNQILAFIDKIDPTYSFHFIDPYGIRGVERRNVEKIVAKERADCIINMMLQPVSRWISVATKPELNATEKAHEISLDKYFGSPVWREIQAGIQARLLTRQQADMELVRAFDSILRNADPTLTVKQIPLQFQDREQTIYYLFLTTRDPSGAFTMNEILADARIREYDYRVEKRQLRTQPGQMTFEFFDLLPDQNRPVEPQANIDLLAEQILTKCKTRTMRYRDILHEMFDSPYFQQDVREALGKLREKGQADFNDSPSRLTNNSIVSFR